MRDKLLIVGAGPTGLVLALTLDTFNVPFKIIEQKEKPDDMSKAMLVVPGTLEHYSQLGVLDSVLAEGLEITEAVIHGTNRAQRVYFDDLRAEVSRYTKLFTYPQDQHERFLIRILKERGHQIHWNTSFKHLRQAMK